MCMLCVYYVYVLCIIYFLAQRYDYYITKGIQPEMLAPQPKEQMENVTKLISPPLLTAAHLQPLLAETKEEILQDYEFSLRKCISECS